MDKYIGLLSADVKKVTREPILGILGVVPLLILAVCRFVLPLLSNYWLEVDSYFELMIIVFTLLNAMFPAFILAFIILDEKDLEIIPVIHTTPLSIAGMLKIRLLYVWCFSFVSSLLLLAFNGIIQYSWDRLVVFCLMSALTGPIVTLLISAIAKNKVEGLTLLKVASLTLFVPLGTYFIDVWYEFLLMVFPAFWVYHLINPFFNFHLTALAGLLVLLLMNYYSFRFACRKLKG